MIINNNVEEVKGNNENQTLFKQSYSNRYFLLVKGIIDLDMKKDIQ